MRSDCRLEGLALCKRGHRCLLAAGAWRCGTPLAWTRVVKRRANAPAFLTSRSCSVWTTVAFCCASRLAAGWSRSQANCRGEASSEASACPRMGSRSRRHGGMVLAGAARCVCTHRWICRLLPTATCSNKTDRADSPPVVTDRTRRPSRPHNHPAAPDTAPAASRDPRRRP